MNLHIEYKERIVKIPIEHAVMQVVKIPIEHAVT